MAPIYYPLSRMTSYLTQSVFFLILLSYSFNSIIRLKLRIDVLPSEAVPEVRPYLPGTPLSPPSPVLLAYPIILTARQKANYFVEPESFNLLGMLRNPMVLMMVVTGALVMGMPYLMVRTSLTTNQRLCASVEVNLF